MGQLTKREQSFVATVWNFYAAHQRSHLPWRQTTNPYHILVSELMLQQTQVDRVIPKYRAFIEAYPTTAALAAAPLGKVLALWQGLGYNRRAKYLQQAAQYIEAELYGEFPKTEATLRKLPGVGPYTAAAVCAFAFDAPAVLIETNVRQVMVWHFFRSAPTVSEAMIRDRVEKTLPTKDYRGWYSALMDYGSHLKRQHGNLTQKSTVYSKQSAFKGSNREIRGAILRVLTKQPCAKQQLLRQLAFDSLRVEEQLSKLLAEGLIVRTGRRLQLP